MDRRTFVAAAVLGTGSVAVGGSLWRGAAAAPAQPGAGPYGPMRAADANGIRLPAGFRSRVVARSGRRVGTTSYTWHDAPDGGACFADGPGWIYVSNSEVGSGGGVGMIRFNSSGRITAASRLLAGTRNNCAGGATPWKTWLSCEEVDLGLVYETYPFGGIAAARPAMGRFQHEAAAVDPVRRHIYLTEDEPDGCLYRFIPSRWPDLSTGTLEVATGGPGISGPINWAPVPDPDGAPTRTRNQVAGAKRFNGGEGCIYDADTVWFTTKGDNRVWQYNIGRSTIELAYDDSLITSGAPLTGVDNIERSRSGDLFVAEDGGNMEMCIITPDDVVASFLRIENQPDSEITGPAFSPDGSRLYFSSQRGPSGSSGGGITYEVRGPFRS